VLVSIQAEEKSGKSTMALTAPKPLVMFSFDMSNDRAINGSMRDQFKDFDVHTVEYDRESEPSNEWEGHDITIYELPQPIQLSGTSVVGVVELWKHFIFPFANALQDDYVKTLVIDTSTIARRVRGDASLQEVQIKGDRIRLTQLEWGVANDSLRNAYTLTKGLKKNLIAVHHLTDEYGTYTNARGQSESLKTGNRILEGLGDTPKYMDIAVQMEKGRDDDNQVDIRAKILVCGFDLSLEGLSVKPTWNALVDAVENTGYEIGKLERA